MALRPTVASLDDVDEKYRDLYTERGGQFELTGVEGMKTQADVDRLKTSLEKERVEHKRTKDKFAVLGERDPNEILSALDRIPELEHAAEGKIDDKKMSELVEARLATRLGPVERERDQLKAQLAEKDGAIAAFEAKERQRSIHDAVRRAAVGSKVIETALDDVLLLAERVFEVGEDGKVTTKDGVGVTPGVEPSVWLTDMQKMRPHWWPNSQGGGARGGSGGPGGEVNPFSAAHWNLTAQGTMVRADRNRAEQMAKAAGTTIGGPRPTAA